jgi:predicted nucleic acid-binding protein
LDAGPLGALSNPNKTARTRAGRQWLTALTAGGCRVIVPEITDYEVRRELIRANGTGGLANLDWLGTQLEYLPLTTTAMRRAAELWAVARQQGRQTAPDPALDADVILAAQAQMLGVTGLVVATMNPRHLSRFVPAEFWQNITP